jgi:hypothetical protein
MRLDELEANQKDGLYITSPNRQNNPTQPQDMQEYLLGKS